MGFLYVPHPLGPSFPSFFDPVLSAALSNSELLCSGIIPRFVDFHIRKMAGAFSLFFFSEQPFLVDDINI